jgi:ribosomal protein S14
MGRRALLEVIVRTLFDLRSQPHGPQLVCPACGAVRALLYRHAGRGLLCRDCLRAAARDPAGRHDEGRARDA